MKSFSAEKLLSLSEESSLQLNGKYTTEKCVKIIDLVKKRLNTSHDLGRELAVFLKQPKEYDLAVVGKIRR